MMEQPSGNNDTSRNQARSVTDRKFPLSCAFTCSVGYVVVCMCSVALLALLFRSVLQDNLFSVLYLGSTLFCTALWMLIPRRDRKLIKIMMFLYSILCLLVLASKFIFQVLQCSNADAIRSMSCNDLSIFGEKCSQYNNTVIKPPCPLKTFYKDILWDLAAVSVFWTVAITFYSKFRSEEFMEKWDSWISDYRKVAHLILEEHTIKRRNTQSGNENSGWDRLFIDGNEQQLLKHFKDCPATDGRSTSSPKNDQLGKEKSTRRRTHRFNNSYCRTLLRIFIALSGINLPPKNRCEGDTADERETNLDADVAAESQQPMNDTANDNSRNLKWSEIWFWVASVWPVICYFLMIVYTTVEGSVLSLVYPFLVFCWALLSSGRWHTRFWTAATFYTLTLMIFKNMFKWSVISWNNILSKDPFYPPRIVGLEKSSGFTYVTVHLVILLAALLIECCILKFYGTWDTSKEKLYQDLDLQASQDQGYRSRPPPDVYWCAFSCDSILFVMLIVFKVWNPDENLFTYVEQKHVSWTSVLISGLYFFLIILERILYIKGWLLWKLVYHFVLVIGMHAGLFFILPWWHLQSFSDIPALQGWYFIRCIAFALSAYQCKNGYSGYEHGHLLTKHYTTERRLVLSIYLSIPFLMEIHTLLGYIFAKTCLSQSQWFQCEDIYTSLFIIKYAKLNDKVKTSKEKCFSKCYTWGILVCLIIIIWFPMLLFSFLTQDAKSNPPTEATLTVSIGGYEPLFQTTATAGRSILSVNDNELEILTDAFGKYTEAGRFLKQQNPKDMSLITFSGVSLSTWGISTQGFENLKKDLSGPIPFDGEFQFVVEVEFRRHPDDEHYDHMNTRFTLDLKLSAFEETRSKFYNILQENDKSVKVMEAFPRFIHLGRFAEVKPVSRLVNSQNGRRYRNLTLKYYRDIHPYASQWGLEDDFMEQSAFQNEPNGYTKIKVHNVNFITFNDRIVTISFMSLLKAFGIIALYTGVIWAFGRVLRGVFTEDHSTLMFRQLDNVDPLLHLVEALYNMIEEEDFDKQRRLYQLLISLYADPVRLRDFTSVQEVDMDTTTSSV